MAESFLKSHFSEFISAQNESCQERIANTLLPTDGTYCPAAFDGLTCFNYTTAGTFAFSECPEIYLVEGGYVSLYCEPDGRWSSHPNYSWLLSTDRSGCFPNSTEDKHHHFSHIYLYFAGVIPSIVLLVASLVIFQVFRQLRCDRITVHKNLFVSFLMNAVCWTMFFKFTIFDGEVTLHNPVWCQVLHVVAYYFNLTSFAWMFCEGIYLHFILVRALRTGKLLIKCLIAGGWGVPLVTIIIYGAARGAYPERRVMCWIDEDILLNIIAVPIYISTAINTFLLIHIVYLLLTKLRQIPEACQSRKAAKAILILVPLFGLQHLLMPFQPEEDTVWHRVYQHVVSLITSLQGAIVSIIFCFCNGEVRSLIVRKWKERRLMSDHRRKNTATTSTFIDGYSMVDTSRDFTNHKAKNSMDHHNKTNEALELKATSQAFTPLVDKHNDVRGRHGDTEDA